MSRSAYTTLAIYLAALVVVWLGVWPFWQDIRSARSTVALLQDQVTYEHAVVERLGELEETINKSSERIAEIEQAIPPQRDVASVIAIFEEASVNNGLSLSDIVVDNPDEQETQRQRARSSSVLDSFTAQIELSGRYGAFTSFLDDIETSFPLLDIATLSFSIPAQGGQTPSSVSRLQNPVLDFSVELQAYYNQQ